MTGQLDIAPKTYDQKNGHAFWSYVALADKVDEDYLKYIPIVQNVWGNMEAEMFANFSNIEKKFLKVYQKSEGRARIKMTKYCAIVILQQHKKVEELVSKLD